MAKELNSAPNTRRTGKGLLVGLTGGIASGKSTAAAIIKSLGVEVLDADDVAHGLLAPGEKMPQAIAARFGRQVLAPDGSVNRPVLGRIVFGDPSALKELNALMHPPIWEAFSKWRDQLRAASRVGVGVIPLLFENGREDEWDVTLAVVTDPSVSVRRMLDRGLSKTEAEARLAAQLPMDDKEARADYVIRNDGTMKEFERNVRDTWSRISKEA